mmetsp:Transcript_30896/g.46616  ORF Transcript_30896/g.46616 Transcript_30896/m.46616 type:complete len:214 (+) Transcript_30896:148-789(+)|eukprot:CAMPEP_0206431668 /NCGR_PEP_ID=MMETSP0324_2-20121206/7491_1 /ASSEMBLY_ACC=CAM_ASM_000836 /TAXON_ID=2866 /ORGANISM="Crypthecodinium cohnii, Strain Seligo" /LENGTH=213 /DNA_ID=CAMNT_0053897619 /DNA_START=206 /DNA_END=847 /DNA_ORIENTATION=-
MLANLYDEYAVGWNDLFDEDEVAGSAPSTRDRTTDRPPAKSSSSRMGTANPADSASFWRAQATALKKPPVYLRIPGGSRTAVEKGIKERLLDCPIREQRKSAEAMEGELDQLREAVLTDRRRRRTEARQNRRLQRRCRVRKGEDLEALEEQYRDSSHMQSLLPGLFGPSGSVTTPRRPVLQPSTQLSKDFFAQVALQRLTPRLSAVPLPIQDW